MTTWACSRSASSYAACSSTCWTTPSRPRLPGDGIRILAADADAEQVELLVVDEGSGIQPQDLERVFERFYRGDRARGQTESAWAWPWSSASWRAMEAR